MSNYQGPQYSRGTVSGVRGRHEDYLRTVRGTVNTASTTAVRGIGFTITINSTGDVTLTFSPAFASAPSVVAMAEGGSGGDLRSCEIDSTVTASAVRIRRKLTVASLGSTAPEDGIFNFVALGPT